MPSNNESDRIKEAKKKIKVDAEIKKLKDEAERQAFRDKLKKEIKRELVMQEIFKEVLHEIFEGKSPDDFTDDEKQTYERMQKLFEEVSEPDEAPTEDKEIINLRIKNIDTLFVESMKADQKLIIEIDRTNKEFIIREEADEDGGYALINAEIID